MKKLIELNPKFKKIDNLYFENYGGLGYDKSYLDYTYHPLNVINQLEDNNITFKTLLDAGCASGNLVKDFRKYGIKAFGIDNNTEILKRSICPDYTFFGDIRDLSLIKDNSFDVIYLNSLMYLMPQEIIPALRGINRICIKAVFLCNPFLDETDSTSDLYRAFLAKRSWWDKQFKESGFIKKNKNIFLKN